MKYLIGILSAIALVVILIFCPIGGVKQETEYLRIHIRANSNSTEDQNIKYKVKDAVVEALIPLVSEIESFDEAKEVVAQNFDYIESVANDVLENNGFTYKSKAQIKNEYFPTRCYEDITLEEGYYDALIINLGTGEGNNWWCIVFPAFCFTRTEKIDNIVYISKIWEIINSVI